MNAIAKVVLALCGAEAALSFGPRRWERQRVYENAHQRAMETGKPLVIVGAPRAGFVTRLLPTYGCGDLCIDLAGCPTCPEQIQADVGTALQAYADDSAVVCVICTLEYVDEIDTAKSELYRVAGPDLFVSRVEPWSLTAFVYPGAKHRLLSAPQGTGEALLSKPLPWRSP